MFRTKKSPGGTPKVVAASESSNHSNNIPRKFICVTNKNPVRPASFKVVSSTSFANFGETHIYRNNDSL